MEYDNKTEEKEAKKLAKKRAIREQHTTELIDLLREKKLSDEVLKAAEKSSKAKLLFEVLEKFLRPAFEAKDIELNNLVLKIINHPKPKEFADALALLRDCQLLKVEAIEALNNYPAHCESVINLDKLNILTEDNFKRIANPERYTLEESPIFYDTKKSMQNIKQGDGLSRALVAYEKLQSMRESDLKCSNTQKKPELYQQVQKELSCFTQAFFTGITQRHDPQFFAELLKVIQNTKSLDIINEFVFKLDNILTLRGIRCITDGLFELNEAELLTVESFNQVLEMQFPWHFTLLKNSKCLSKETLEKLLKYDEPISSVSRLIEMIDRNKHEEILKDVRYAGGSLGQRARVRRDTLLNGENLNKLLQRDHSSLSNISDISEFLKTADLATEKNIKELINKDSKISKVLDFLKEHQLLTKENFSRLTGHSSRESASNFLEEHNLFSEENMNKLALESYPKVSFFQPETELPESKSNPSCSFNLI
ncbi:MAG: hypothetical protein WA659_06645 [Candidatus Aquirickettsiella sp.]